MPKRVKKARTGSKDANQLAHGLVRGIIDRTETPQQPTTDEVSRVMAALGRKGGKIGGKRRLETMTPERRSEIALRAARARWNKAAKKR
jgi:hypothetical protein